MIVRTERWNAIGTNVDLLVNDGPVGPAKSVVAEFIDAADRTYSRFRPDSELSRLNESDGRALQVSPLMALALDTAMRGARLTGGLVDPTVGRVLRLAGYDRDYAAMSERGSAPVVLIDSVAGWMTINWQPEERLIRLPRGVELDFGATGKALIVDRAAAAALAVLPAGSGVLVSVGGDIRVAGVPPAGGGRVVMAENSREPRPTHGEVALLITGGLATSSSTVRQWRRGRVVFHHLIDPRTGRPTRGPWRTVSVAAASCVDANIASTAAMILGGDAVAWLGDHRLPARLVSTKGEIVYTGGWASAESVAA
jgi:thiamine biosynthesis lipoprotein